jgi:hypothetical protein
LQPTRRELKPELGAAQRGVSRASLRIRFDSSTDLSVEQKNKLIRELELNALRENLVSAIKCS